jgi:hypothetical protein
VKVDFVRTIALIAAPFAMTAAPASIAIPQEAAELAFRRVQVPGEPVGVASRVALLSGPPAEQWHQVEYSCSKE